MKNRISKVIAAVSLGLVGTCFAVQASAQTAPTGAAAFPSFGTCSTKSIPGMPQHWSADVLLTPFQSQPLQVARTTVSTFEGQPVMFTVTDNLPSTTRVGWLTVGGQSFKVINGPEGSLQCNPLPPGQAKALHWQAPSSSFLKDADCTCMGSNKIAEVEADAWRCPNGTSGEYDWFWFSQDSERKPVRFLFSRDNNQQNLPVLGNASLNHFTNFQAEPDKNIEGAIQACLKGNEDNAAYLDKPSVAGVTHETKDVPPPPTWTNTAFANGALFAVDGTYTSMAIYYDWNNRQEVSKILSSEADKALYPKRPMLADTRLTKGRTFQVSYDANGNRIFPMTNAEAKAGGILGNVGIWRPDWATNDACQYKATIAANSPLNPTSAPLQAMSCYFAQGIGGVESNIQAWYSYEQQPVMFYETNAGDLDLIDYYQWIPNATIPDGVLYPIPDAVKNLTPNMQTECNACHGKIRD